MLTGTVKLDLLNEGFTGTTWMRLDPFVWEKMPGYNGPNWEPKTPEVKADIRAKNLIVYQIWEYLQAGNNIKVVHMDDHNEELGILSKESMDLAAIKIAEDNEHKYIYEAIRNDTFGFREGDIFLQLAVMGEVEF